MAESMEEINGMSGAASVHSTPKSWSKKLHSLVPSDAADNNTKRETSTDILVTKNS